MRLYKIHRVDSFANAPFEGNPTVTVFNADTLKEEEMKKIAREMNVSETGFVLPSQKADFRLRYFTPPGDEVKFCGHATIGALCAIAKDVLFGCDKLRNSLTIETNAGIVSAEIDLTLPEHPRYILDAPKIHMQPSALTIEEIASALGISKDLIDPTKPVAIEKLHNYLYLASPTLETIGKINPDMSSTAEFCLNNQIVLVCIMTGDTFNPLNHLHARGFAPLIGVPEDPFTGSMQGGLAAYAIEHGLIPSNTKWIGVEQGHFMHRPGSVKLEIQSSPLTVKLHAEAAHLYSAELRLP